MKLKSSTVTLLAIALILGAGVAVQELQRASSPPVDTVATASDKKHFSFALETVQSIAIRQGDKTLKLYRGSSPDASWLMDNPSPMQVSPAAMDFLLRLFADSQSDRDFEVEAAQLPDYGLAPAQASFVVQLVNGKTHQLLLGNPDFKGDFLYALIDPPATPTLKMPVYLVSRSFQALIRRSPQEWQKDAVADPSPSSP